MSRRPTDLPTLVEGVSAGDVRAVARAITLVENRDPLRDQGPFAELAVTGRQWSAASALSNDYLAVDGRLDRIRLRVELALARAEDVAETSAETKKPAAEENSDDENIGD